MKSRGICVRFGIALTVMAFHLSLWWWQPTNMWSTPIDSKAGKPVVALRLLPLPSVAPRPSAPAKLAASPSNQRIQSSSPAPAATALTAGSAASAAAPPTEQAFEVAPNMPSTADAGSSTRPLDLSLPRAASAPWRSRNPAMENPFARKPATLESSMAAALRLDGPWVEERLDNDRVRLRNGSTCITAYRARGETLDPFSQSSRAFVWSATPAEPC